MLSSIDHPLQLRTTQSNSEFIYDMCRGGGSTILCRRSTRRGDSCRRQSSDVERWKLKILSQRKAYPFVSWYLDFQWVHCRPQRLYCKDRLSDPLDKVCAIHYGFSTGFCATVNVAKPKKGSSVAIFELGVAGLANIVLRGAAQKRDNEDHLQAVLDNRLTVCVKRLGAVKIAGAGKEEKNLKESA